MIVFGCASAEIAYLALLFTRAGIVWTVQNFSYSQLKKKTHKWVHHRIQRLEMKMLFCPPLSLIIPSSLRSKSS